MQEKTGGEEVGVGVGGKEGGRERERESRQNEEGTFIEIDR